MNKIFKVIWSKSKQCYVVVSEIAKNTTGKKKIIVASILATLAMQTVSITNVQAINDTGTGTQGSVAIGYGSQAKGTTVGGVVNPSVAVGTGSYAEGNSALALGTRSWAKGSYNVSVGREATSSQDYGIAIGYQANVSAIHGMALGERAAASGQIAVAVGANAKATGANSFAGGFNSESGGTSSVALGESATSSGDTSVAIGKNTVASSGDAVSIGTSSQATGGDAVSIGSSSQATGGDSIALGKSAKAKNGDTIAIGQDAEASLLNAVALGKTSKATGASATALGPQSTASATFATAIGMSSVASQEYAIAIGGGSEATVERGVALGTYSKADTASGVAGYNANANRTNKYAGLTGNTLTSTWGAVSVGDGTNTRQMTGLAAGTKDTDAVNVAQLKSVNLAFTGDNSSSGDVNLANSKLAVTGDTTYITTTAANQGITVKGVKKDITVSNGTASASVGMADAKNVAEAINQANADQKITYKANGGTANSVKLSDGLNFSDGTSTVVTVGTNGQVTYDLNAATKKSINDSEAAVKRTISLGADSGTRSSQSLNNNNVDFNVKGSSGSYITTSMAGNTVNINTTKGTIQSDASGTASLSGADGLATAQNVATAINKAKEGSAWNLAVNTGAAQKVAGGTNVTLQNGKNIALTQTGTTITVGTTSQLTADSVTVGSGTNQIVLNGTTGEVSGKSIKTGNSTLDTSGLTISGGPSVTSTGINAGNKVISGVSQGVGGTDAVNKSQMDAAIKTVADSTSELGKNTITLAAQSGSTTGQALNSATGIRFNINGESGSDALISTSASGANVSVASTQKLKDAVTQAANAANKDLSNLSTAGETHIKDLAKTAATWNVSTNGSNNTAVAGGETVNFINGDNVAITNTGRNITISTAKNVSFDKVTLGGITIDKTNGINAGGKEIKGIADATAADSAVSKSQMETAIANAQTAASSTEKVVAKTLTGDNNLATVTGQTGTAKNETYEVAVSENAVKAVAVNAAQDAVKVAGTGLATVSDATAAGVKTYTVNVEEGKLVLDDTTGNIGAAGSTQGTTAGKDGVATTQNVAKAINDAVTKANANNAQALADAEHKFDGDTGTTSVRKHGEVLSVKGGVTTPADLTTGNIGVVSDGAGTLNVKLAKALTGLTSATYTDGAGNTQTVTGASSTITDGAGNTTALTKGGLSTTDGTNTTTVTPNGMTATDGTNTVKVEGTGIDAGNTEIKNVAAGTTNTSAVNKKQMEDAVKAGGTWKVTTNTGATTEVTGGDTVDFINGDNIAITNTGRNITIGTAKTVSFDKVTVGGITIDKTDGINAGGKEIKGIADATAADSAVSKGQMDTAIANAQTAATSTEKVVAKTLTGDNNLATVTGQTGTAKNETYEVAVSENAVKAVAVNAAQDAVKVAGTGLATVSDATAGGVKTYTVNVEEGKLVLDDATGNVGAAGSTQGTTAGKDGVATTQNVAKAINEAVTKANTNNAQALADAEHKFDGDTGTTSVRKHGEVLSIKGGVTTPADLTTGNIGVVSDGAGTLNVRLAKVLTGLTSATYTDAAGNTTTVTGGSTTIADAAGNTQTLAPTKSEIKDNAGVSTVTTKDGVTTTDAAGNTTALTKGGLSTKDGTNTTIVAPTGVTATDGTHTVKVEGSGIDAGNTEIKNVAAGTTNTSAVNKKQMDDAITKATGDATHEFGGDDTTVVSRKHGEQLNIKGGASTTAADLTDGNIAVLGDATTGTLNLKLAKALTGLTSATYTDAAGNTTTVTGGTTTIADAAGNTQTLAPTKSEIKDNAGVSTVTTKDGVTAKDAAGNTTALTKGGLSTTDGTNITMVTPNGLTATDGTNTVKVEGSGIDAGNTEIKNVAAGTTNTSAVNKKQMEDAVKAGGTWKITTNTGATTEVTGGDTVDFINGDNIAITNTGRNITIGTAKTVSFDKVTVGGITIDKTDGINAGGKELKGIADATAADSAVSKGQMDTAIANAQTAATSTEKVVAKTLTGDNNLATVTGQTGTAKNETYEVAVSENAVKAVAVNAAQDAVKVAGTGLATVSDATAAGVKTYTVNVEEGKLVLDDTTGNVGAAGSTQGTTAGKDGVATTQNVAKVINDAVTKANANNAQALADAEHKFDGDTGTTSVRKHGEVLSVKGGVTTLADLTTGNIGVVSDGAGTLNVKLAKALTGLTSATYTDAAGNTTTVTGGTTTIADAAGNTQTLAPTKSEIKDNAGVSTVTTKDGVTAKDAAGHTTALTNGGVNTTDAAGNTTALTNGGVSTTDGAGNTTALTKGGLSTTDGTNTTTVTPNGMTATDGTNTVKVEGSGIDAGNTEIKNVAAGTTNTSAVNKKQMDDAISKATGDATHEFVGDDTTVVSRKHGEQLNIKGGASTAAADLTDGNIAVLGDATTGTLNLKLAKALTGLTSATYTDAAGNTTTVTGGSTTIADAAGNTQTLAPTKSEIKDNAGVSTVTTKDGVTAKDAAGNTTALTNGGVNTTDGAGNTTALTKGGLSTTDGTNTTTVTPNGMTATDGTNTVKVEGTGIDAGNTEIKNVAAGTTNTSAVNKKQMDDAITKATGDATHEFGGDDTTVVSRKHGEQLNIKGGASTTAADLTDGNIAVLGDATTGTLNLKLAKVLTGLTSATYTDAAGNTTTVTGGSTTIADAAGNTQTLAPTKSEIKDNTGVSTVTTKDGMTAKDAAGNTTALTNGGVSTTDGAGNTTALTKGGLSTTDGTNTTTVTPNGMTATDGTNTVKVEGSGIDAGNTEIKNVAAGTTNTSAVNKKQMDDAISKATGDATHEFAGDDTTVVSRKHGEQLNIKGGASTVVADLTDGNIAVLGDATTGTLNLKLAKALTGLTSATYTDVAGNTTTVTGGSTTIADAAGNSQTLAPTKSEIKDNAGVSTVTTKDGVTATDAAGNTTALTNGGVSTTDGAGNTTALTKGGLSTTDGTNTTTVTPKGMTATDGTNTVKVEGSGIDAGNTEIKNVAAGTTNTSAVNKKQMDDAISKATSDATHEFAGDTGNTSVRKHGEVLSIKGGVTDTTKLSDNNIGVVSDGAGTLNVKLAKDLVGLNSATYTDAAGNTTTVTGGTTTISDAAGNTQTLAPTKSEIKDSTGVSTVTTKDGVTAKDAAGNTTALTNSGVSTTDGAGNTTALTKGGLSTTDGTNTTTVTPNGLTATDGTNTVKVNGSGIDAGNTEIKNVADGTTAHSAVNKNQLDTAVNRLQNATDNISLNIAGNNGTGNIKLKDQVLHIDGTNGLTTKANGQSVTVGLDDATMSTINNTAALANNAAKKDLSNIDQAGKEVIKNTAAWHVKVNSMAPETVKGGDTVTFNDGHNITITNTGKDITVATKKEVTFDKVSVGGITIDKQADHISGVSSITGSGSGAPTMTFNAANGSTPSSVSMDSNLDMGGKQINNVAAATRPTDAVNKQQVDQAMKSLAGMADSAAKKYASKAGANAAALAALKPIQYDPLAPTQIMAGIGNYKSQTAVAIGVAHYANEDTMFNIGASLDSQDAMLNAGVTHKFGSSAERKDIPDRYKGGPISSIYVMQDEVSALKAQNSEMQAMLDKQSSENAAIIAENKILREQNEEMQRKVDLILSKLQ
ncbi:ESPR-type extended signal peptide-containing protein [Veillonella sp. S13053-19]|uniref:ESPR-type extended signal peptide-containing protein n=1 Tax=Veillonella sp. S13053-19 TaxID=2027456 RepID=UPI0013048BC5|nr:ESPR-type extended signal peptide-containing protein [Veillonella sp. S13053-19]